MEGLPSYNKPFISITSGSSRMEIESVGLREYSPQCLAG